MNIEQGIMNFEVMLSLKISSFDIPCSLFPARPVRRGYSKKQRHQNIITW